MTELSCGNPVESPVTFTENEQVASDRDNRPGETDSRGSGYGGNGASAARTSESIWRRHYQP